MGWADSVLLGTIALSVLVGGLRGFIKEVLDLAVWLAAFLVAFQFSGALAENLQGTVSLPSARMALAFGGLFIGVLLVGALATYLVGKLVETTGLTGTDRLLGGVFGAARGLMLTVLLILAAGFTPLPRDPWWQESFMIGTLMPLAELAADWLPESIREHLELDPEPVLAQATV